jgi:hypothetical protein
MNQKTIEDVLRALTNMGYEKAKWGFFGFEFQKQYNPDKKAELAYHPYHHAGKFVVSTVSSHWTVEESADFIKQLTKATEDAKTLNLILKRSE